jgi:hypothetical protein
MVYHIHNCWVFGLCPSSCILETRKKNHNVFLFLEYGTMGKVQNPSNYEIFEAVQSDNTCVCGGGLRNVGSIVSSQNALQPTTSEKKRPKSEKIKRRKWKYVRYLLK